MGSGYSANSSYTLPVNKETIEKLASFGLIEFLKSNFQDVPNSFDKIPNFIEELYFHDDVSFLPIHYQNKEIKLELYYYDSNEGEVYDDLKHGLNFIFDFNDLFIKSPLDIFIELQKLDIKPEISNWVSFG